MIAAVLMIFTLALRAYAVPQDPAAAETLYRSGKYAAALEEYQKIIAHDKAGAVPSAAALFYNSGNCYYRLQKYPEAALYYHRALLRNPRDPATIANLRLTEQKLAMAPPPPAGLITTMLEVARTTSATGCLAFATSFEILGLGALLVFRRRRAGVVTGILLLMTASGFLILYLQKTFDPPAPRGLVTAPEARLYSEPRTDLPVLLTLKPGETLDILEQTDQWARVAHGGRTGWTPAPGVGVID